MNKLFAILTSVGVGAALMYIFDPDRGGRRRALVRDKAVGLSHDISDMVGKKTRHLSNKAEGVVHEAKKLVTDADSSQSSQTAKGTV
jgi:hypothetical protein